MSPEDLFDEPPARRVSRRTRLPGEQWTSTRARSERGWGVGALVEEAGAVLLVREGGRWFLPGGMLEAGERPREGATREVHEETGVDVTVTDLLAVTERTFVNAADGREFKLRFATFRGEPMGTTTSSDPGLDGEGISSAAWHEELPMETFDRDLVVSLREESDG
ncbi:NUDIX domain-containing protein [Halosegnis sp.]|uniref:NUDIX domain-containing protein n=1 Tax=Halosegnis sp. TaxID=2864959 RepID=UPI0035D4170F